ncbi:unnamed protein product [Miscanthus lutarioriparius]|uniref:Uncharacterized protein n=1 Tax=Miscanthus lutarioriparius TaxID=422564 RepID=A0A811Q9U7_9POAL|nr:unnamed protein product [Miscanthus lutarioriparius]
MDGEQAARWAAAQEGVPVGADLVAAALRQLQFLAAVDRRRWLYEGPLLDRAIRRYKACWLPLLDKHTKAAVVDGPLVVPLDCEWIWHCHRLNPVQYIRDCKKVYGRILNNNNVESSTQTKSTLQSEKIWKELYPEEPFELVFTRTSDIAMDVNPGAAEDITYDLVSAVKRQSSFYYQVGTPTMHDPRFLQEALARYKAFLYLIKMNQEKGLQRFRVPTYDVDLLWHTHQLHPVTYRDDMVKLLGKVLEHDDTDADRSEGKKLDVGFTETTEQFESTFGLRYWKAGCMYRGNMPSPVTSTPQIFSTEVGTGSDICKTQKDLNALDITSVELYLQIVDIKNLPSAVRKENVYVRFTKNQSDMFISDGGRLDISTVTGKNTGVCLQCEPTGELILVVMVDQDQNMSTWTRFVYDCGTELIRLQIREHKAKNGMASVRELVGVLKSPKKQFQLAEFKENKWTLKDSNLSISHGTDGSLLDLKGFNQLIKLYQGRKLEYERKCCSAHSEDVTAVTAVKFCAEHPYGKAVALLDTESQLIMVNEDWFLLPWITTSVLFMDADDKDSVKLIGGAMAQKDALFGSDTSIVLETQTVGAGSVATAPAQCGTCSTAFGGDKVVVGFKAEHASSGASRTVVASGENGHTESAAGCGSRCGPMVVEDSKADNAKSGGCGSGCDGGCGGGGGCGTMLKASTMASEGQPRSGGCGGGCGSGCGGGCGSGMVIEGSKTNTAKSGGCGSGCGGGCGTLFNASTAAAQGLPNKSAGCGSGCGGAGCGSGMGIEGSKTNNAKSGGCGSGCGGGCGGGCGTLFSSGGTAADQGQSRPGGGCGSGSGCGGGGCGSGSMVAEGSNGRHAKFGGCGSGCGGGCGGGGGYGTMFNVSTKAGSEGQNSVSGGCGSGCGGGGCGGGCGTVFNA